MYHFKDTLIAKRVYRLCECQPTLIVIRLNFQVVDLSGAVKEMKAPCLIPELNSLCEVKVNDPRYWPMSFHKDRNWDLLKYVHWQACD